MSAYIKLRSTALTDILSSCSRATSSKNGVTWRRRHCPCHRVCEILSFLEFAQGRKVLDFCIQCGWFEHEALTWRLWFVIWFEHDVLVFRGGTKHTFSQHRLAMDFPTRFLRLSVCHCTTASFLALCLMWSLYSSCRGCRRLVLSVAFKTLQNMLMPDVPVYFLFCLFVPVQKERSGCLRIRSEQPWLFTWRPPCLCCHSVPDLRKPATRWLSSFRHSRWHYLERGQHCPAWFPSSAGSFPGGRLHVAFSAFSEWWWTLQDICHSAIASLASTHSVPLLQLFSSSVRSIHSAYALRLFMPDCFLLKDLCSVFSVLEKCSQFQ